MITGIGIDLVEIERIKKSIQKFGDRFLNRVFTDVEGQYCESKANKYQHYAVRFAGKEALLKAFGSGLREGFSWKEIEFINDEFGKPVVRCFGKVLLFLNNMKSKNIHVSFSHSDKYATAIVIIEN